MLFPNITQPALKAPTGSVTKVRYIASNHASQELLERRTPSLQLYRNSH
jgi:hypothetical protein